LVEQNIPHPADARKPPSEEKFIMWPPSAGASLEARPG
jgi:hypothetical protein